MMMYIVKKWIVKKLNDLLKSYKDDVDKCQIKLNLWTARIQKILDLLTAVSDRISDGVLEDEEIEKTVEDVKETIKTW